MTDLSPITDFSLSTEDNFGPIGTEYDVSDLPVAGELPRGLNGTLFRNGPNPQFAPVDPRRHHWFLGDGMIHAFTLRDGRASHRNRWVRTDKWVAENAAGRSLMSGFGGASAPGVGVANTGVANTNIVWFGGRLLALEEAHLPFEMDPATLATRGVQSFDGALQGPFTAHPKIDPVTGELVFFGYSTGGPLTPGMTFGTISAAGRVTRFERFEAPYCSMVHDFAVTEGHVLFPVLPLSGSMKRAMAGQPPFAWEPELGGHIGVLRRDCGVASLRWFRAENCYVFHVLNAWDEGNRIVADVIQYDEPPLFPRADGRPSDPAATRGRLVRWTLDLDAGTDAFKRIELDGMSGEFPRLDERRAGLRNRFGLYVGTSPGADWLDTIVWLDLVSGARAAFTLPRGDAVSEAVFVPRGPGAAEGDGWLLAVAWRCAEKRSDLIVLDTDAVARGPVATVQLAHRVPFGFHGNWAGDAG
ncbi:MAG: carotenoid oxygenase family protein [Rhodopila sp.]|jgi:carotenoid cleavage dioxygenase